MNSQEVRFVYIRDNVRPVTVAYLFDDEKARIAYNHAVCGDKDAFSRKVGRAVASGRLEKNVPARGNKFIPYAQVGVDGMPKYGLIASELHYLFGD